MRFYVYSVSFYPHVKSWKPLLFNAWNPPSNRSMPKLARSIMITRPFGMPNYVKICSGLASHHLGWIVGSALSIFFSDMRKTQPAQCTPRIYYTPLNAVERKDVPLRTFISIPPPWGSIPQNPHFLSPGRGISIINVFFIYSAERRITRGQ